MNFDFEDSIAKVAGREQTAGGLSRILWAIDGDESDVGVNGLAAKTIGALMGRRATVEPVFVLGHGLGGVKRGSLSFQDAEERLMRSTEGCRLNSWLKPEVIVPEGHSRRGVARALVEHALNRGSELIVVATRPQATGRRLFSGSLGETLAAFSPLPVLVVGAGSEIADEIKTLVFATDFSDACRQSYQKALEMARSRGFKLVLFHHFTHFSPFNGASLSDPLPLLHPEEAMNQRLDWGRAWAWEGGQFGVEVEFQLSRAESHVEEAIAAELQKVPAPLLVMTTHAGPLRTVLVGSMTRRLIRSAGHPVLVLHGWPPVLAREGVVNPRLLRSERMIPVLS